jgi:hypothetical protein
MDREKVIFIIISLIFLSGCAGVLYRGVTGNLVPLSINTEPSDAEVICGVTRGLTPTIINVDKRKDYTIFIRKEGYKTVVINLKSGAKGGGILASAFGNVFIWGPFFPIGMAGDVTSGALKELKVTSILINLEKGEGTIHLTDKDLIKMYKKKSAAKTKAISPKAVKEEDRPQD